MRAGAAGFTLIELLVGSTLFALVAAGLAQALISAQQHRTASARWSQAAALAEERLERLRAGDRSDDDGPIGAFERVWHAEPADGLPGLERIEVVVTWTHRGPQRFALTALQREAR